MGRGEAGKIRWSNLGEPPKSKKPQVGVFVGEKKKGYYEE